MRALLGALLLGTLLLGTLLLVGPAATPAPTPCPSPGPPVPDRRHPSGLWLVGPEPRCHEPIHEALGKAASDAGRLSRAHPEVLGQAWDDRPRRELVYPATPAGEALVREWVARGATVTMTSQAGPRSVTLPRPEVPVRIVPARRSYAELQRVMDALVDVSRSGVPRSDGMMSGIDAERQRVTLTVRALSDELAGAIVARVGTEDVAVLPSAAVGPRL